MMALSLVGCYTADLVEKLTSVLNRLRSLMSFLSNWNYLMLLEIWSFLLIWQADYPHKTNFKNWSSSGTRSDQVWLRVWKVKIIIHSLFSFRLGSSRCYWSTNLVAIISLLTPQLVCDKLWVDLFMPKKSTTNAFWANLCLFARCW